MNLNEYQKLAMRTSQNDGEARILNGCLGLIGESGEVVDVIKKYMFQSGLNPDLPVDALANELGDVLWYCAELATGMRMNLDDVANTSSTKSELLEDNMDKLSLIDYACFLAKESVSLYTAFPFQTGGTWGICEPFRITRRVRGLRMVILLVCGMAKCIGVTPDTIMERNIEKLKRRYPDGFDPERSIHRTIRPNEP